MARKCYIPGGLLIIATIAVICRSLLWPEPMYQGKTVNQWFDSIGYRNGVSYEDPAVRSLIAMGPDAVPFLFQQFKATYTPNRERNIRWLNKLPGVRRNPEYDMLTDDEVVRRLKAFVCLQKMGADASQIIPDLILMSQSPDWEFRWHANELLAKLKCRPEISIPAMEDILRGGDLNLLTSTMEGLGAFGTNAQSVLPTLTPYLFNGITRSYSNALANGTVTTSFSTAKRERLHAAYAIAKINPPSRDAMRLFDKLIRDWTNSQSEAEIISTLSRSGTTNIPTLSDFQFLQQNTTNAALKARLEQLLKAETPKNAGVLESR